MKCSRCAPKPNESPKAWIARATELFDPCQLKTKVTFPQEARGWILLHRAGLSEEQQAVVLARAQGKLEREQVASAMRSCYPDLVCSGTKTAAAHLVKDSNLAESADNHDNSGPEIDFEDVELLLSEYQSGVPSCGFPDEIFLEPDVAEVLAVSRKEKKSRTVKVTKAAQVHCCA